MARDAQGVINTPKIAELRRSAMGFGSFRT
jgi:hypothetical protein